jgi:hypothetical protein
MTFISIHSVIIYVVFFGACMRCTRLCSLKPGVTFILALLYLYVVQAVFEVQGILRQELQFRCNLLEGSFIPLRSSLRVE